VIISKKMATLESAAVITNPSKNKKRSIYLLIAMFVEQRN
jgi:hypothetical protein